MRVPKGLTRRAGAGLLMAASVTAGASAQGDDRALLAQDLKRMTLEQLAELDITTASRRVERISEVPAAVSIVPGDDVIRSGVASLPEAMRLADALDVARVRGNSWAVSARGFTITSANKLLVMIDGRTVYSPLFSGTFWDVQDIILADIDRIEVVRGPGGSTWGANAVNGVINIVTKPAAATRGTFVNLTGGSVDHFIGAVRHGGRLGAQGSYRVYGKIKDRGAQRFTTGESSRDPFRSGQGGFRLESGTSGAKTWLVQGDIYRGSAGLFDRDDTAVAGGNIMGRWGRRFSGTSEVAAQVYYDGTYRRVPEQFEERRHTVDVEALHRRLSGRHHLMVGGHFRVSHGRDIASATLRFEPEERTDKLLGLFVQDEIALRPARVYLTLGTKVERNDFTGFELQPTARLRVTLSDRQTAWSAISRAVRLPTRVDADLVLSDAATGKVTLTGSGSFESETVVAYEAGYRVRPHPRVAFDAAVFTNRYDDLRSQEVPLRAGEPIVFANMLNASTAGVELATTVQPFDEWRVHASYAYLSRDFSVDPGSRDPFDGAFEANDPSHLFSVRSWLDLPHGVQLDAIARVVGRRPSPVVDRYGELDLRVGWAFRPGWNVSVGGHNLLNARHSELFGMTGPRYALRRGAYLRTTWRF